MPPVLFLFDISVDGWQLPQGGFESGLGCGNQFQEILGVDLFQNIVGKPDPMDVPKSLRWRRLLRIRKIFIPGFEKPPVIGQTQFWPLAIGTKQYAVLVANDKVPTAVGLPAEFGDAGSDFDVQVRIFVEPLPNGCQVFWIARHVRPDKNRL